MSVALELRRGPQNDDELHALIIALWGISLPRVQVCPDHVAPFKAVADAYFGRAPGYAVWYASRGSGKSLALAILGLTKTLVDDADVTILGGSMTQSQNVATHMSDKLHYRNAPVHVLKGGSIAKGVTATQITTSTGRRIRPIPASQTTVRGPHPPLTLLDEVDEMEYKIYEAAMGQAMEQVNSRGETIGEYIVASSTWQNIDGCVVEGTKVTTLEYGDLAVEAVPVGCHALTRQGWKEVTHRAACGRKATVTVVLESGRQVTCTPDHEIATDSGWVEAALLLPGSLVRTLVGVDVLTVGLTVASGAVVDTQPASPSTVRQLSNGLGLCEVMAVSAHSLPFMVETSASQVDGGSNGFEVTGVDASPYAAQVIQVQPSGNGSDELLPHPAVGQQDSLRVAPIGLVAVTSGTDVQRPQNAVVGVEGQGVVPQHDDLANGVDRVVEVRHSAMLLPMWDLTITDVHEYVANGIVVHNTFSKVMDQARKKGLPIYTWCWRELLEPNGWMSQRFIDQKRQAVTEEMWRTEYELNEPSGASRAFDLDALEQSFVEYPEPIDYVENGEDDQTWVWEDPITNATYSVGVDWAKEIDKTVIACIRTDILPRKLVYLRRVNKQTYRKMIASADYVMKRYDASGFHDKTGLGNVVHDFSEEAVDGQLLGFNFSDRRKRSAMLLHYVADVEHGGYLLPRGHSRSAEGKYLSEFHKAHRSATVADVYGTHKAVEEEGKHHLPDDIAAMALAHRAAGRIPMDMEAVGVPKHEQPRAATAGINTGPSGDDWETVSVGGVTIVDERYETPIADFGFVDLTI